MSDDVYSFTYEGLLAALDSLREEYSRPTTGPEYIIPPYAYKIIQVRLRAGELLTSQMIYEAVSGKSV